MAVSKKAESMLDDIKKDISQSYDYFRSNYQRYHEYMTLIYKSSITPAAASSLTAMNRPLVEFNILEAYISRLCGEFSKMDPSFFIRAKDNVDLLDYRLVEVVEAHMKAAFMGASHDQLAYRLYKEALAGGFAVAEIYTDYLSPMSFDQGIFARNVFDSTLCGFDPLARMSHKGDGRYAYQNFPKSEGEAVELFGSDVVKNVSFTRSNQPGDFNWYYRNESEKLLIICEYFRKHLKKTKIVQLSNGHTVPEASYEKFVEAYNAAGYFEQPPIPVRTRWTEIETIDKYTLTGNTILNHERTNFSMLPLVFFDGNSVQIRDTNNSPAYQFCRPYIYQATDAQKMKNFAGQTLCNELQTLVQHKWKAPIEAIPDNVDYQQAYINPQNATILMYNQFYEDNTQIPINPPQEIVRPPIPPEIMNTFIESDRLVQNILGSYDATMGINRTDVSGVAIMQGAMHSNAAAMPYTMGFIAGWNRLGEIYLDLLPKYYNTPRTIPVELPNGKRDFYKINQGDNVHFNFDVNALEVTVEAGVNFAVQKQISMETIERLMQTSESFKQFINAEGLEVLLDNIDIRGVDKLKAMAAEWMKKVKQAQEQAQQQQAQAPSPAQIMQSQLAAEREKTQVEAMKVAQREKEAQLKAMTSLAETSADNAVKNRQVDVDFIEVMSKVSNESLKNDIQQEKVDAENARSAIEAAMTLSKHASELDVNTEQELGEIVEKGAESE